MTDQLPAMMISTFPTAFVPGSSLNWQLPDDTGMPVTDGA
jgi:hypothetical protein